MAHISPNKEETWEDQINEIQILETALRTFSPYGV